jgi:hypothetical protein
MKLYLAGLAGLLLACGSNPDAYPSRHDAIAGMAQAACKKEVECVSLDEGTCEKILTSFFDAPTYAIPEKTNAEWDACEQEIALEDCSYYTDGKVLAPCQ